MKFVTPSSSSSSSSTPNGCDSSDKTQDDFISCVECAAALDRTKRQQQQQHKPAAVESTYHGTNRLLQHTLSQTHGRRGTTAEMMPRPTTASTHQMRRPPTRAHTTLRERNGDDDGKGWWRRQRRKGYYAALGVCPTATHEEIVTAYRRLVEELECPICNPEPNLGAVREVEVTRRREGEGEEEGEEYGDDEGEGEGEEYGDDEEPPDLVPDEELSFPSITYATPSQDDDARDWTTGMVREMNELDAACWVLSSSGMRLVYDDALAAKKGHGQGQKAKTHGMQDTGRHGSVRKLDEKKEKGAARTNVGKKDLQQLSKRLAVEQKRKKMDVCKERGVSGGQGVEGEGEGGSVRDAMLKERVTRMEMPFVTPSCMSGEVVAGFVEGMGELSLQRSRS